MPRQKKWWSWWSWSSWSSWSSGQTGQPGHMEQRGETSREDRQIWHLNLIFEVTCEWQLLQFDIFYNVQFVWQKRINWSKDYLDTKNYETEISLRLKLSRLILRLFLLILSKKWEKSRYQEVSRWDVTLWLRGMVKRYLGFRCSKHRQTRQIRQTVTCGKTAFTILAMFRITAML